jgi:methionyl-tRNA formyltransferase
MRIAFMGTPEFAVPTLQGLLAAGHEIVAVYTQPPRPAGRGMHERLSPVHRQARQSDLPVFTPKSLKPIPDQQTFAGHDIDAAVVVAYGLLLPKPILAAPRHGCFNLHASALPRWRGAAPIQRAIMAGDSETAAAVMRMDEGLDTGPVCRQERVAIGPDTTAGELHDLLALRGASLMLEALAELAAGRLLCAPQPVEGVTYATKIDKRETRLDFTRPAQEVHNHIRGLAPLPGAWLEIAGGGRGERIKVLRARLAKGSGAPGTVIGLTGGLVVACAQGAIRISEVQRPGKRPMPFDAFLRGFPVSLGTLLVSPP